MNYEEKYGEKILTDAQERQEEERIKQRDRLEDLERAVDDIKDLVMDIGKLGQKEYEELIGEIRWIIQDL